MGHVDLPHPARRFTKRFRQNIRTLSLPSTGAYRRRLSASRAATGARSVFPLNAPLHRNLTAWAENGVLLLNTCLTVKAGEAGSHSGKGWEEFTDRVVDVVDRYGGAP